MSKPLVLCVLGLLILSGCLSTSNQPSTPDIVRTSSNAADPILTNPPSAIPIDPCEITPDTFDPPALPATIRPSGQFQVDIIYDGDGIPHVYADNYYELWFGNGYAQARERLFQMDALRLVGYGESARYLGAGQLMSDFEVQRELYDRDQVAEQVRNAPKQLVDALRAYADGVNAYILQATTSTTGLNQPIGITVLDPTNYANELPGEFPALGRVPDFWSVDDSFAVINYLIGFFGTDGGKEITNAKDLVNLQSTIGEDAWKAYGDLNWLQNTDHYATIPADEKTVNGCERNLPEDQVPTDQWEVIEAAAGSSVFGYPDISSVASKLGLSESLVSKQLAAAVEPPSAGKGLFEGLKFGSNAALVHGDLTDTGESIMWGAPQMGLFKPPVPFHVGLHSPEYDAVGMGVVGAPSIIIGRNAAGLAYSATSGNDDQKDIFAVRMGAGDRTYIWDGQQKNLACKTVEHQTFPAPADLAGLLEGQPPAAPMTFEQEVCYVEGDMPVMAHNPNAGYWFAVKSTTRNEEASGAAVWFLLSLMPDLDSARELMFEFPFTFNMHMAGPDGIQVVHTGNVPLRAEGYDYRFPLPGGSATQWRGEALGSGMGTWIKNPEQGYLVNWNNAPAHGWRAGDQRMYYGEVHRGNVLERLVQDELAKDGTLSYEDVKRINEVSSVVDSFAYQFLPWMVQALETADLDGVTLDGQAVDVEAAIDALRAYYLDGAPWADADGDGRYDHAGHALYDAFLIRLYENVFDEWTLRPTFDLQEDIIGGSGIGGGDPHSGDHGPSGNQYSVLLDALKGETSYAWCQPASVPCQQEAVQSFLAAYAELRLEYGPHLDGWLRPVHQSQFTAISAASGDVIPMLNRGSHVQFVSLDPANVRSETILPPSNTGRLNSLELALAIAGMPPERITADLECYYVFCYRPMPLTRPELEATGPMNTVVISVPEVSVLTQAVEDALDPVLATPPLGQ